MRRLGPVWIVGGGLGFLLATGMARPGLLRAADAPAEPQAESFNVLAKIAPGMTMLQVVEEAGPPTEMKGATYYYKGRGRVVFEGSAVPGDKTKVLRVEQDVMEDGIP